MDRVVDTYANSLEILRTSSSSGTSMSPEKNFKGLGQMSSLSASAVLSTSTFCGTPCPGGSNQLKNDSRGRGRLRPDAVSSSSSGGSCTPQNSSNELAQHHSEHKRYDPASLDRLAPQADSMT